MSEWASDRNLDPLFCGQVELTVDAQLEAKVTQVLLVARTTFEYVLHHLKFVNALIQYLSLIFHMNLI